MTKNKNFRLSSYLIDAWETVPITIAAGLFRFAKFHCLFFRLARTPQKAQHLVAIIHVLRETTA